MSIRKSSCWLSRFSCIRESMALAGLGVQDELQPPRRRAGAASAGASSWRSAARLPRTQIVIGMENRSFADTRNRSQMSPFERRRQAIANTIQQTCGLSSAERLPKRFCMAAEDMGPRGTLAFPWVPCPLHVLCMERRAELWTASATPSASRATDKASGRKRNLPVVHRKSGESHESSAP